MANKTFTLEALEELDQGMVSKAFAVALKRAAADCIDMPGIKATRKVCLVALLTPVIEHDGDCNEVSVDFVIQQILPKRTSKRYSLGVTKGGGLYYNGDSPTNVKQQTLLEEEEGERGRQGEGE